MLRWNYIKPTTYYRKKFEESKSINIETNKNNLDFYSYKFLGTELEMYKIMDINFIDYIEKRGDLSKIKKLKIPSEAA